MGRSAYLACPIPQHGPFAGPSCHMASNLIGAAQRRPECQIVTLRVDVSTDHKYLVGGVQVGYCGFDFYAERLLV